MGQNSRSRLTTFGPRLLVDRVRAARIFGTPHLTAVFLHPPTPFFTRPALETVSSVSVSVSPSAPKSRHSSPAPAP